MARLPTRSPRWLWIVGLLAAASPCAAQEPPLFTTLVRMGQYLVEYEDRATDLAADEDYEQWTKRVPRFGGATIEKRKLLSTFFLVRLPDGQAWYGLRDVTHVNGKSLKKTTPRMADVLSTGTVDAVEQARVVTRENARYNIGPVYRDINLPFLALALLHPRYRLRFQFTSGGVTERDGRQLLNIDFDEQVLPSIISDGFDGDVPVHGRVVVDPTSGAILRTELQVAGKPNAVLRDALLSVDYEQNAHLRMLLPRRMDEKYELDTEVLYGRATYKNYRRFETSARLVTPR